MTETTKLVEKYILVRQYKPHKGYTDETHIKAEQVYPYIDGMDELEMCRHYENEYEKEHKTNPRDEVVASVGYYRSWEEVDIDEDRDKEIEAKLFEGLEE